MIRSHRLSPRLSPGHSGHLRGGNILIVVLLLLALFATIGLTVVYYTRDLSEQQRINIEAQSTGALSFPDDGSVAFNLFLSGLIYDQNQSNSALWGHSLMRTMYGGQVGATVPWNGIGTFHENYKGVDRALLVNLGALGGALQPETSNNGTFVPMNAAYTYPDLKDFYLASFVPGTGEVLSPSFYRSITFKGANQTATETGLEPWNPNWTNKNPLFAGRLARPRPIDNGGASSAFPLVPPNADGTYTGDVQNLTGSYYYYSPADKANTGSPYLGQYVAHNDSIWMDIGLQPITLLNGKTVKPLVAPLIVDLDGMLNYNVHGNANAGSTVPSGSGFGPWEVNLSRALANDGSSLITGRGTPYRQPGTPLSFGSRIFNPRTPGQALPPYSAVSWAGGGGAAIGSLTLPSDVGGPQFTGSPTYSQQTYDFNTAVNSNPVYAPSEWGYGTPPTTSAAKPQPYPVGDLQYLLSQYCGSSSSYSTPQTISAYPTLSLSLNKVNASTIRGGTISASYPVPPNSNNEVYTSSTPEKGVYATRAEQVSGVAVNANRSFLTPYSYSLDYPGLAPNFFNIRSGNNTTNGLSYVPGTLTTGGTFSNTINTYRYPFNANANDISDVASGKQLSNSRAALGPIDLNRPLADYRGVNPSGQLSPTNIDKNIVTFGSVKTIQAVVDRQQFAMSIFVRLIVATGADATYQMVPQIGESIAFPTANPPAPGSPGYNALQALAQLAANIVDYIDSDDVSTAFVWNPINVSDPLNAQNFSTANNNLYNRVVFGVEKPRLVLNEAYAEVTNDPNDPTFNLPKGNAQPQPARKAPYVRFWLELQNPSNFQNGNGTGPLGGGSVQVYYPQQAFSPYEIQIARSQDYKGINGTSGLTGLSGLLRDPSNPANPSNVTGGLMGVTPDITFDFSTATGPNQVVAAANGSPNTAGSILVCAPANTNANYTGMIDWNPNQQLNKAGPLNPSGNQLFIAANPPAANATNTLTYNSVPLAQVMGQGSNTLGAGLTQHLVLLRRLANPYLPPNDPTGTTYNAALPPNPYITVDFLDFVPATDRLLRADGSRTNRNAGGQSGYAQNGVSLGKVQPYTSWTAVTNLNGQPLQVQQGTTGTYPYSYQAGKGMVNFPSTMVVQQTNMNPPPQQQSPQNAPSHTFGSYNRVNMATVDPSYATAGNTATLTDSLMSPFEWIPHFDRPLINQAELFTVSLCKPHELTQRFLAPNAMPAANDVQRYGTMAYSQFTSTTNTLYRALDVLRIQPYGQMTALGGRVPGKININTVQDKRVWDALFDAQPGVNGFTGTGANNDVANYWNTMIASRTGTMKPRYTTVPGTNGGTQLTDTNNTSYNTPIPGASVYDSTNGTDRPFLPFGAPAFAAGSTFAFTKGSGLGTDTLLRGGTLLTLSTNSGSHPYRQTEALRKILNNTTTVSHSFAVWVTVGYFEYNEPSSSTPAVLGAEYFSSIPGDLRRKYFAIVDRSLVGLDPSSVKNATAKTPPVHYQTQPFFTTVDGTSVTPAGSTSITITTSSFTPAMNQNGMVLPATASVYSGAGNSNPNFATGGSPVPVASSSGYSWVVIGTGATQEIVQVTINTKTPQTVAGATTFMISTATPLNYPHWPGEFVSNIVPGNPGPQSSSSNTSFSNIFNYAQTPYSYIVPYTIRLQ